MPLIKLEQIIPSRFIGIWHITENLEQLIEMLKPMPNYQAEINAYKVVNKKLEWAAARLTVKKLTEQLDLQYFGIGKNKDGKPLLVGHSVEVSLTHSYPYVAAIIDEKTSVGIDLEQPKEKLRAIAHKFLSAGEQEFIKEDIHKLCIAWCAKETLYKIHSKKGLIFKDNIALEPYELSTTGSITGSIIVNDSTKRHKLDYKVTDDYVITYNT